MKHYLLIDGSYYVFYRYYALLQWWKNAKPDEPLNNPAENSLFIEKFKEVFIKKLKEIPKKLKLQTHDLKIYVGKDCPRETIWRVNIFPDYKANRVYDETFMGGAFFKMVYAENLFDKAGITKILKCKTLEADDCLALTAKRLMANDPQCQVTIIASDHDYLQLVCPQIQIYNLKFKNLLEGKDVFPEGKKNLFLKTIMGDKSDNIPSIFPKCGIKTALKCYEDPEYFKTKITPEVLENYKKNDRLVNFNNISQDLQDTFYAENNIFNHE